jgi:hypothetical protein
MFLNAFTDRSRPDGQKRRCKHQLTFDFVVAERPMYVPGSGPPLAPVTVMPANDKDGVIQGEVKMDNQLRYIVGYEKHPYLRVSVKPQNILDWVSPRTLEDWEFEKAKAEYQADEDELLPKIMAREQRKKLKEQGGKASRASDGPKKTWSRKRKRPPTPELPLSSGRKRRDVDTEDEEALGISLRRPSLSTPVKQRGLAEVLNLEDSEEEEESFAEDATKLLDRQFHGTPTARSKLRVELARSPTTSPDPQPLKSKKPPGFDWREIKSGSKSSATGGRGRETRSSSSSRPPSRRDSVAATSSRRARAIYEKLELLSQAKAGSLTEKYTYSGTPPTSSQRQAATNASARHKSETPKRKKIAIPKSVEEDDTEYEVDAILADVYRKNKKGELELWYLIKWVGDWDNTWEPSENVGAEAIAEYQSKKTAEETRTENSDMASDTAASYNEDIIGTDLKGKGNQQKKSKLGIDDAASFSSEELEFRAKGKRRVLFGSGGRDIEVREKGKMKVPFGSGGIDLTGDSSEEESDRDSLFVKDRSSEKLALKNAPPATMREQVIDDASASDGS